MVGWIHAFSVLRNYITCACLQLAEQRSNIRRRRCNGRRLTTQLSISMTLKSITNRLYKLAHTVAQKLVATGRGIGSSKLVRDRRTWIGAGVVVLAVGLWILPGYAGAVAGDPGYSIKRGEETVIANLAPLSSWRSDLRLRFANNRVAEAAHVANQANQNGSTDQTKTAATITGLLDAYEGTYEARTAALNRDLNDGKKLSKPGAQATLRKVVNTYTTLELLRLQAPDAAQQAVLTAVDDTQQNIAALSDVLGSVPLSDSDFAQLAKLVPLGIISQSSVDTLASLSSNRELHVKLEDLIKSGQVHSDVSYILDLDLVKQIAPAKAAAFETAAQFAQKSAEIDAQLQTYQAQLNTSIDQVNTELQSLNTTIESSTNTHLNNNSAQQDQIDLLNTQIQTLQTQLQQLLDAAVPTGIL